MHAKFISMYICIYMRVAFYFTRAGKFELNPLPPWPQQHTTSLRHSDLNTFI